MQVTAKNDYALRALIELARMDGHAISVEELAVRQNIPPKYLEAILTELSRCGYVASRRGRGGGHRLSVVASEIRLGDLLRSMNGSLMSVRGECPEDLDYSESVSGLQLVWIATRVALRSILDNVTLADLAQGTLDDGILELTKNPSAWLSVPAAN